MNIQKKTIESLKKNHLARHSILYIFSDGSKSPAESHEVKRVRDFIHSIEGFKEIIIEENQENKGLAASVIYGATKVVNRHGKIIVLEDDLVSSPYFLQYMNDQLNFYKNREEIFSISGYSFSSEFMKNLNYSEYYNYRPMSWGWAIWLDRWQKIDWDEHFYKSYLENKRDKESLRRGGTDIPYLLKKQLLGNIDSWYIRFAVYAILNNLYTVYPAISFINNIGFDNTGTHSRKKRSGRYGHRELVTSYYIKHPESINIEKDVVKDFNKGFDLKLRSKIKIILRSFIFNTGDVI